MPSPIKIPRAEARDYLLGHLGLRSIVDPPGAEGARALLRRLRAIQLDPLDPIGTNADLVVMARVDGVRRGELPGLLMPGHAFEHFAKERCLLPASAFPYYRDRLAESSWWHFTTRIDRLPEGVVEAVYAEIEARGPLTAADLGDHGAVDPIDWSGWKGTMKAASMAIEVLWSRCRIVVAGRTSRGKLWDLPERSLGAVAQAPSGDFARWAIGERAEAAGLLSRNMGPWWSMLTEVRTSTLPDEMIADGAVVEVAVEGIPRRFLAPTDFLDRRFPEDDGRLRILAPLDPLLWDRKLVQHLWDFEYLWEVYKPAEQRRWGWYVHPLLHRGEFVGRLEGRIEGKTLVIHKIWGEPDRDLDRDALKTALDRHAELCGASRVKLPRRVLKGRR
jgi:uncharacterized protein YcaQ